MADLEKTKRKTKDDSAKDNQLFDEVMKSVPLYSSKEEALKALTMELEILASKNDLSVEALLEKAETSKNFNEDHLDALMLARQVAFLKK